MNLYERNGLVFWTEEEIKARESIKNHLVAAVERNLLSQNQMFRMVQVEAPLLTPLDFINQNYTAEDFFQIDDLALRPETTMGSFVYAHHLMSSHTGIKLPFCVWQVGKSFRREQDQPTKFMRFKEFYQLEFQILFAESTKCDYAEKLLPAVKNAISVFVGPCVMEPSDRLPSYSKSTLDVVRVENKMEMASISTRTDFDCPVLEVAIGLDRVMSNFMEKVH